jgi:hypothetical protein
MGVEHRTEEKRLGFRVERLWVWKEGRVLCVREGSRPTVIPVATEYMRVLSRQEVDKIAGEGVDVQQYINSLLRTIEGQRREIRGLNEALRRKASDEAPSFSPNFDERNGIR